MKVSSMTQFKKRVTSEPVINERTIQNDYEREQDDLYTLIDKKGGDYEEIIKECSCSIETLYQVFQDLGIVPIL